MKIISVKNDPALCENVKATCAEKWGKVSAVFSKTANESVAAEALPQTWVLLGGEGEDTVFGFYQLAAHDFLTRFRELSPFLCTLFVDATCRDLGFGGLLIRHAKYEAARLGFEKLYLSTDHIGYYERYGFREIGLDVDAWGRPTKVYAAYTPSEVEIERFDRANPVPDRLRLEHDRLRRGTSEPNPAISLFFSRLSFPEAAPGKWFSLAAFSESRLVGWANFIRSSENALNWYLGDLFVAPDLRRRGIARRLVGRGLDRLRSRMSGGEFVTSYLEKENTPSILLHRSFGFVDTGECRPFEGLTFGENETTYLLQL
ncbi:MAG: GNAT family N-acetyltransferase [Bacteroides sp.]|nr:GNAT family N-acetyltransferase [Eubacterium sp.]MCM1417925.1 GNAT family N-acetyltransferase [Roseburia sp.]MCM1461912.1 GNAT family N-acetyltransferase [Bacteroides sp.]